MGRLGEQTAERQHWVCKVCITANHKTRLVCLSCNEHRAKVEARGESYWNLSKEIGLDEDYTAGMTLSDKEISNEWPKINNKSIYDNSE